MIHHLSVAARDPKAVAEFFADVTGGVAIDFPPNPGSYMTFAPDGHGTGVEVYPAGSVMLPNGEDGAVFEARGAMDGRTATHFALSVDLSPEAVLAKAAALGWEAHICSRGGHFRVAEVWIENSWLVELLPPVFAAEYIGFAGGIAAMARPNDALAAHQPQTRTLELAH